MADEKRAAYLMGYRAVDEAEKQVRRTNRPIRLPAGTDPKGQRQIKGAHQRQN